MPDFDGLSGADWAEISEAVQEGFAFINVFIRTRYVNTETADYDPLWGEESGDDVDPFTYEPSIKASVSYKPKEELLQTLGVNEQVDVMIVVPRQNILEWQADNNATWDPNIQKEVEVQGTWYNIVKASRDVFPVDDGSTEVFITETILAQNKPRAS